MTTLLLWLNYDSILRNLDYDLDYDIYLFRHLQVEGGTRATGNVHQIRINWFHRLSFWLTDSLCNVFFCPFWHFYPFWHFAPIGLEWKSFVGMNGVTYLLVMPISMGCVHVYLSPWHGLVSTSHGRCWPLPDVVPCLSCVSCTNAWWFLHRRDCNFVCVIYAVCCNCYLFCWNMDYDLMASDFGCLTSDLWML